MLSRIRGLALYHGVQRCILHDKQTPGLHMTVRAGWAVAVRTSPVEPGLLHVARVPAAGANAAGGEPWPWRRIERDGAEPYSEVAEDVLRRLTYKVMQVMCTRVAAGDHRIAIHLQCCPAFGAHSMASDAAAK